MEIHINRVDLEDFYKTLESLGYRQIKVEGKTSKWDRKRFHLYTYPWCRTGIRIRLEKDIWGAPFPLLKVVTRTEGTDLQRELEVIRERYRKVRCGVHAVGKS